MTSDNLNIPGFVDLQVNGYQGVDFTGDDLTEESLHSACENIVATGTAALLPTVITGPQRMYRKNLPILADAVRSPRWRDILLGIHLEGPFLNPDPGAHGAHDPAHIRPPDLDDLKRLLDWAQGTVRMLTLAADMPGADRVARHAVEQGIVVALGHHLAGPDDLKRLHQAGATVLTHLGNGVPACLDRHRNPIWAGLADDDFTITMITDGHHLPPAVIQTFLRAKGVGRTIVISDASAAAGLAPGRYSLFASEAVLEENGRLYNPQTGYLAGSSSLMLACMNHLASLRLADRAEMLAMGFYQPLGLLGVRPESLGRSTTLCYDEQAGRFSLKTTT